MSYTKGGQAGRKVILGLVISIGMLLLGSVIITSLVIAGRLQEQFIQTGAMVLLFGATVMGTVTATAGEKEFWIPLAAFTAIQYLVLVIVNVSAFGGGLERLGICTIVIVLAVGTAVGLKFLPVAKPRGNKIKYRFR